MKRNLFGSPIGMYGSEIAARLSTAGLWPVTDPRAAAQASARRKGRTFLRFFEENVAEMVFQDEEEFDRLLAAYFTLAEYYYTGKEKLAAGAKIEKQIDELSQRLKKSAKKSTRRTEKSAAKIVSEPAFPIWRKTYSIGENLIGPIFGMTIAVGVCFIPPAIPLGIALFIMCFVFLFHQPSAYFCSRCRDASLLPSIGVSTPKPKSCKCCGAYFG